MSYCPLHSKDNYKTKAVLAYFSVMNITFPKSYYIWQLIIIGNDCPRPVDKHGSVKNFALLPWPLRSAITKSIVNNFYQNFVCRQRNNGYETYRTGFQFEGQGPMPWLDLGQGQNFFFSEYDHVAYQIKGNDTYSNMVANIWPYARTWPLGWVKRSKHFFRKVVLWHIKLKGMEHHESKNSVLSMADRPCYDLKDTQR